MTASAARLEQRDEAADITAFLRGQNFPPAVKGFELEFEEDWSGEPAVWVWLLLDEDVGYSAPEMPGLSEFARRLQARLLEWQIRRWPYVSFRVRRERHEPSGAGRVEPS